MFFVLIKLLKFGFRPYKKFHPFFMQAPLELVGLGSFSSMDSFASWKMNGSGMEKEERERRFHFKEKMSLEEAYHHRRPWIRAWRKKEMNEGRGREEHEILCSK